MKKIFSLFILSFFLVSLISAPGYGQKVSDFLEKMIKAQGMMGGEVEEETFLSDYRKVNGVMIAHTMTALHDGEQVFTMSYTEVKLNTGLEDSLFKPLSH